jgi:hypothetical protein
MTMRKIFASIEAFRLFQPLTTAQIEHRNDKEDQADGNENDVSQWKLPKILDARGLGSDEPYLRIL